MRNIDKALLLCLFGGYTAKLAILGSNYSDALIILVLAAAHFLYNSQIQNKQIQELTSRLNDLQIKQNEQNDNVEDIKSAISSLKISQGLRPAK
jgi:hypothetical protein